MQRMVKKLFADFGAEMLLKQAGQETAFRGFLQPNQSQSWQSIEQNYTPLGEIPRGQYILFLPPQIDAQVEDRVMLDGKNYNIRRLEKMLYRDEPVYSWGLCTETDGEDTWGMNSWNG